MHTRRKSLRLLPACAAATLLAAVAATDAAVASPPPEVEQLIAQLGLKVDAVPVRERATWRPLRRIVVRANLAPQAAQYLAPVAAGAHIVVAATPAEALAAAPGADAFLGFCEADLLAAAPGTRWVQAFSAGIDHVLVNGVPVVRDGNTVKGAMPGKAVTGHYGTR